ncbi:MAG TPA: nitrite reductase large subunit NirB [Metabacillus sp.]|nr:nitrite reductase large subunit NirB [Metabacillus sp.]
MKQRLVVIGNGMAGVRCIEEILKQNTELYDITIIGSEPHVNYNRILLSSVLQGETTFSEITINDKEWYKKHQITLYSGETAIKIDSKLKVITTDKKKIIPFDKLILATGSSPFVLPLPGVEKPGVVTFRTIEDCKGILEASKQFKKALVIGGGVLGLEAARGLLNLGLDVTVVHNTDYLMQRQLDAKASRMLQKQLEQQGIRCLLGKVTKEISGTDRVEEVEFTDGTKIEADLVVMSVGVVPNISLAKESGILTNRGIVVNDFMETSIPDIYAVGECVEHNGVVYGLVKPLYEQGEVLAKSICGKPVEGYKGSVLSTSLKVPGIDLFSVGEFEEDESTKTLTMLNEVEDIYKKLVLQGDIIVGAILYGETRQQSKVLDMIVKRKHVSDEDKRSLLHSIDNGSSSIKSMKLSEMICNCNGVTKGAIMEAVQQQGLTTVKEVKQCTKASSSCGGCKLLLTDLVNYIHSDECDEFIEQKSLCSCTTLTEDEVVLQIQQRNLTSLQEVFSELDWGAMEGCSSCVPAIRYYLSMIYPERDGIDQSMNSLQNMRVKKLWDGTYAVTPQLFGGKATSEDLRRLANVMERYHITDVGITAEQRIQLKGIKQENIHAVCSELSLSPVTTNTVRHINTYFSEKDCQCDTNDRSLTLSIELEKELEFLLTPHKLVISVSGCKHKEIDMRTKDICVVGADRGWEIFVGGSLSPSLKQGELFTVAAHEERVKQMICGLIQYYRETANYLEQLGDWVERVGMIHIREVLFEDSLCDQLVQRLEAELHSYVEKSL